MIEKVYNSSVKQISNCHKVTCGCEIFISVYMIQSELNLSRSRQIEKFKTVTKIPH